MPGKRADKVVEKAAALQPADFLEPDPVILKSEQVGAHLKREKATRAIVYAL